MKIINIIKAILLLSVVITLPSCLDLDPKAQLADANLWQTPNDYKLYANQFYEWPRDFAAALFDGPHSDTRSDLITSSDYNEYSKGVNTIPVSDGNYTGAYTKIRYANILLQKCLSRTFRNTPFIGSRNLTFSRQIRNSFLQISDNKIGYFRTVITSRIHFCSVYINRFGHNNRISEKL